MAYTHTKQAPRTELHQLVRTVQKGSMEIIRL